jgi:hypothetical protein
MWDPTDSSCDDGSPVSAVDLAPGETVTCTFVNTKRGRILIDQVTLPSGDSQQSCDPTDASCSDGSPVNSVDLAPGETVTCTFVNTKRGRILIDQVTLPAGDTQQFAFSLTGGSDSVDQMFLTTAMWCAREPTWSCKRILAKCGIRRIRPVTTAARWTPWISLPVRR